MPPTAHNLSHRRGGIGGKGNPGAEIERRLSGRVISVPVGASKEDIITYLRAELGEDETPDAMEDSLEADILEKIPENISELCVGAKMPQIPLCVIC